MKIDDMLESAVEYNEKDPHYRIPSYSKRKNVQTGQTVRLIVSDKNITSWVWVIVTARSVARYTGTVRYAPWNAFIRFPKGLRRGDTVHFMPKHIANIQR
jgi:hypothetical protein